MTSADSNLSKIKKIIDFYQEKVSLLETENENLREENLKLTTKGKSECSESSNDDIEIVDESPKNTDKPAPRLYLDWNAEFYEDQNADGQDQTMNCAHIQSSALDQLCAHDFSLRLRSS